MTVKPYENLTSKINKKKCNRAYIPLKPKQKTTTKNITKNAWQKFGQSSPLPQKYCQNMGGREQQTKIEVDAEVHHPNYKTNYKAKPSTE